MTYLARDETPWVQWRNGRKDIESIQWFINGCGGVGKTYLVHLNQQHLKDNNSEYCSLAPTKIAALLDNCET
jgi:hypothetical protein